jgi:hypothetical protein
MRKAALVLSALALALPLAGCGGAASTAGGGYAQGLMSALGGIKEPTSLDAQSLAALAGDYRRAAERLGSLTPPAAVAASHAHMVASISAYADDLDRASKLTNDPAAFPAEMARAQADAQAWTDSFKEIQARGYAAVQTPG